MDLQKLLQAKATAKLNRRQMLANMGVLGAGALLTACGTSAQPVPVADPNPLQEDLPPEGPSTNVDVQIGNLALNLEYLEAEYYLRGVFGVGLEDRGVGVTGVGALGNVIGGRQVDFSRMRDFQNAEEIALDEEAHVVYLRNLLQDGAAARPTIDFTNAFDLAGQAAGLGAGFDAFADADSFILGAFIFEDVGVTAYNGAAPFITSRSILADAVSVGLVEGYHAGDIRNVIFNRGGSILATANAISAARGSLGGGKDQAVTHDNPFGTTANITPTDENALAFARTPLEVLNIVYLDTTLSGTPGGFFPDGVNGEFGDLLALTSG
ncbi:MAG: ferritin-like domain-containing protein [Deinococcota bacterium]|nr:ferritin-like domain-containing protein [Deinococcota bacterium]